MIYYFLVMVSLFIGNRILKIDRIGKNRGTYEVKLVWVVGIVLVALCGFRSFDIGKDTLMYKRIYENYTGFTALKNFYAGTDFAYYLFCSLCASFLPFRFFLIICSIVSITPVLYVIDLYSCNKGYSLALYILFGYYTFNFSGIRQALAIGICAYAFHLAITKQFKLFLLVMLFACLIHYTAILFLPIYWVNKFPFNMKMILMWISLGIAVFALKKWLVVLAGRYVRVEENEGYVGSYRMMVFMLLTVVVGIVILKQTGGIKTDEVKTLLYMQIIAFIIGIVATSFNNGWTRMYYYYHLYLMLFVPALSKEVKEKWLKYLILGGYILVGVYLTKSQFLSENYMLSPYKMF